MDTLLVIDRLWLDASNGKFGLGIHGQIYYLSGGTREEPEKSVWNRFGDQVGWRQEGKWLDRYSDAVFSVDSPSGHLPAYRGKGFILNSSWDELTHSDSVEPHAEEGTGISFRAPVSVDFGENRPFDDEVESFWKGDTETRFSGGEGIWVLFASRFLECGLFKEDFPSSYERLRNLLKDDQLELANTYMNELLGSSQLIASDETSLSCEELKEIDDLWVNYSGGRFGLSIQYEVYRSLLEVVQTESSIQSRNFHSHFEKEVGWRNEDGLLLSDSMLTFSLNANAGHLPVSIDAIQAYTTLRQWLSPDTFDLLIDPKGTVARFAEESRQQSRGKDMILTLERGLNKFNSLMLWHKCQSENISLSIE